MLCKFSFLSSFFLSPGWLTLRFMKSIFMYFSHTGCLGLAACLFLDAVLEPSPALLFLQVCFIASCLLWALTFPPAGLRNFAWRAKSAHRGILSPIRFSNEFVWVLSHFSHVPLSMTLWSVAHQAPLSKGPSRLEYWSVWRRCSFTGSSLPRDQINLGKKNW